jgi:acetyl-CoA carboxylase carboxyltransferase component
MLVKTDEEGIDLAKAYLSYFPSHWEQEPPPAPPAAPGSDAVIRELIPADENKPFDIKALIDALVDADSFLEVHPRWAKELVVGYARLEGGVIGIVANQPKQKGGVLFVDSADKAARFIQTCNAFNVPLLFLADVPGFMIGTAVERQGIIRHGAKMISAVSEATGAQAQRDRAQGLRRRAVRHGRPGLRPRRMPGAPHGVDRGDGAAGRRQRRLLQPAAGIEDPDERARRTEELRREYAEDIDILHLASELVVDAVDPAGGPARRAGQALRPGGRARRATGRASATRSRRPSSAAGAGGRPRA